jgi:HEAT repeat protein
MEGDLYLLIQTSLWARDGAARALGYLGKEIVPELMAALGHPSPEVRLQVARALGFIGEEASTALHALRQRHHDPDPAVRAAAETAIKAIQGSEP